MRSDGKVYYQSHSVYNGSDERRSHYGGVKTYSFCAYGKDSTDYLCENYREESGYTDNDGNYNVVLHGAVVKQGSCLQAEIDQYCFYKTCRKNTDAAEN